MKHEIVIESLARIDEAAAEFLREIGDSRLVAFYASMGAGKTTFSTAVCRVLGVEDDAVSSPTFAIVNEYRAASGDPVFHFDFYRIKRMEEVYDMGYEDYIYSNALCFMEWPELIEPLLPEDAVKVTITANADGTRDVEAPIPAPSPSGRE